MDIVNSTTQQGYINKVNALEPEGWTCIGCGLELALELLDAPFDPPHGSLILLITDGRENRPPFVASVMQKLEKSLIEVSSFAIGRGADEKLEVLAAATKGQSFCFPDGQPFNGVNMGVAFVTASASEVEPQWPVTVLQIESNFSMGMQQNFTIDAGLGKNTIISIRLDGSTKRSLKVELTGPSGQKCAVCKGVLYGDTTRIALPGPVKTGTWMLHLKRNSTDDVQASVRVFSQLSDNTTETIITRARMINVFFREPYRSVVIVDVTKGKKVVLNASVTGKITDWLGETTTLRPRDNGQDPDVYADDGKYSIYYTKFTGSGRYILKAYVSGHNVNVSCRRACSASSNMPLIMKQNTTESPIGPCNVSDEYPKECCELSNSYPKKCFPSYNGTFEYEAQRPEEETINGTWYRVVDGGSFYVDHNITESMYPPLKPWKFQVCFARPGNNGTLLVEMSWNWAGAHLNSGKASSIDIRVSKTSASLEENFESQGKIDSTDLVKGTLEPGEAFELNEVTISLSRDWAEVTEKCTRWQVKFAARTTNSLNVTSELSDVADFDYFDEEKYTSEATVSVPTRTAAAEKSTSTGGNTAENDDVAFTSTIQDSDDDQKYTSKAPRKEPPRYTKADKGNGESTGGHSAEDSNDGTSTSAMPLVLALIVAAVGIASAGLWALKKIKDEREDVVEKKGSIELTATTSVSVQ
ncbi:calcium-activated chloride channel regulator 4-like isoform X2 [Dermacentor andersoni]|uniref:calcium-activated chloride channel regulator 4-like isoform X2 n=1 Tax=Dermacentor andersoni TaxID=34620 RepID=UPI003B3ACDD4